MGERRKVFRIEEAAGLRPPETQAEPRHALLLHDIMQELTALRSRLSGAPAGAPIEGLADPDGEIERLASELRLVRSAISGRDGAGRDSGGRAAAARIASELEAVVVGSEQATQKILVAAEDIGRAAANVAAMLGDDDAAQGLAQDIRDRVTEIFEACNYQDLAGQRVAKVMTTLDRIERRIARALNESAGAEPPLHGPRLPDDRGHLSQADIDRMFAGAPSATPAKAARR